MTFINRHWKFIENHLLKKMVLSSTRIAKRLPKGTEKPKRKRPKLGENDPPMGAEEAKKYRKCERCYAVMLGKNYARFVVCLL